MQQNKTVKLVMSAVFCALVFAATYISVPAPTIGNINLGDCMLIISALVLGGPWAMTAAGIGAALCDLASPYAMYAPGTLIIKALMVLIICLFGRLSKKAHIKSNILVIIAAIAAEAFMTFGYFVYESLLLGYGWAAAANIPFNAIQGLINTVLAFLVYAALSKAGVIKKLNSVK